MILNSVVAYGAKVSPDNLDSVLNSASILDSINSNKNQILAVAPAGTTAVVDISKVQVSGTQNFSTNLF